MAHKVKILILFLALLLIFGLVSRDNYQRFQVSKYGVIVDAIVANRYCTGKNSEIYVSYNNETYPLWVSYSNCINGFPDGSILKVKYLEGYGLQFPKDNTIAWALFTEGMPLIFLIMIGLEIYKAFFPKKLPEEN